MEKGKLSRYSAQKIIKMTLKVSPKFNRTGICLIKTLGWDYCKIPIPLVSHKLFSSIINNLSKLKIFPCSLVLGLYQNISLHK